MGPARLGLQLSKEGHERVNLFGRERVAPGGHAFGTVRTGDTSFDGLVEVVVASRDEEPGVGQSSGHRVQLRRQKAVALTAGAVTGAAMERVVPTSLVDLLFQAGVR